MDFLVETVWSRHIEGLRREKRTLEIQLMAHRLTRLVLKYNALSYATRGLSADLQASAYATARKEWREASDRAAAQFTSELCVSCLEPICQCQCTSTCQACGKQIAMCWRSCLWEPGMCECYIPVDVDLPGSE